MSIEQERALMPCPFCGSTNIEIQISTPDREGVSTNLMCSDCGASGPWEYEQGNSHAKADDAWNRRAALQSQDRDALINLVNACPTDLRCHDFHHPKADQHMHGEACKPLERYLEAIDRARRIEGKS